MNPVLEWFRESWNYRELICFFAWRDVAIRYKQAIFGAAWAILQPLLTMIVFTVFFGKLAHIPSDGLPYPIFAYAGLILWTYFSNVLNQASQSLVSNSNLLTKVYFPRVALPCSTAVSAMLDFLVSALFLLVLMIYFQIPISAPIILVPLFLAQLVLLTLGMGLLLAALNVWYRDIKHVLPLMIQLWMFVTPVIFPLSYVPEHLRPFMAINPLTGIVEGFRNCLLLGIWPDLTLTFISIALTLLTLACGLVYFRKAERYFADIV
ncbi:MAG TPA: ABC transporter permease [Pirellulaceae bacterium]|nr:ABC transporter permease [Pirellulaceae bacterium]